MGLVLSPSNRQVLLIWVIVRACFTEITVLLQSDVGDDAWVKCVWIHVSVCELVCVSVCVCECVLSESLTYFDDVWVTLAWKSMYCLSTDRPLSANYSTSVSSLHNGAEDDGYKALTALGLLSAIQSLVRSVVQQPQVPSLDAFSFCDFLSVVRL